VTHQTAANPIRPYRSRREAAGISLRDLERLTGINRGRLSIIERGVPPEPDEADLIEAVLAAAEAAG